MQSDEYKTIKTVSEGFFKDKGSKFYGFAFPVKSEEEISERRAELRKKYHDARHHVFAYRLGADMKVFRASDDGEPANSSGPPILGQIRSHELTDILIVVIRYFGGTKLGIPGLINAYKTTAIETIKNNKIITKTQNIIFEVVFEYPQMNNVMRIIKDDSLKILEQDFQLSCKIKLSIRQKEADRVIEKFKKNHELKVEITL